MGGADRTEALDIYLRAFAEPADREGGASNKKKSRRKRRPGWIPPPGQREVIVFDTETTTDTAQRLTFGVWRRCREIVAPDGSFERLAVCEEGIFHANDLSERDSEGFSTLERYATEREPAIDPDWARVEPKLHCSFDLLLKPLEWFVEERLFKIAYKRKAPLVGFNLPFDLSRIALGWYRPRSAQWQGSFALYTHTYPDGSGVEHRDPYRPPIYVKPIDGHRALIGFGSRYEPDPPDADADGRPYGGEFTDLYPLVLGLTGEKHSLASACRRMGAAELKGNAEHGKITPTYIDYARQDVAATASLYERCRAELDRHPIEVAPHRVLSTAGIGKGYLRAMGVRPGLERQPDFDRGVLGAAASSYYGGRVEANVLGSVPVRYLDVMSMYPTVNVLLGLWGLVCAGRVEVIDATAEVQAMLDGVTLDGVMEPATWPRFVGIAQLADIAPEHPPTLPLRSLYGPGAGAPTIGVNTLTDQHAGWYALPDLVASALLTGQAPRVEQAFIFRAVGRRALAPVKLRGEVSIDPSKRDFFAALIEERQRLKRGSKHTEQDAWRSQALKNTANSTSYGINMEMLREEAGAHKLCPIEVHTAAGSFVTATPTPEGPRGYCFPPIATLITAGARLILAAIECHVRDGGGTIAYIDTDSAAIVSTCRGGLVPCPGAPERGADGGEAIRALSWAEVEEIRLRFSSLNPYEKGAAGGTILELEAENEPLGNAAKPQLHIFALGAKRYALYELDADGSVIVRKFSEHGLGMRLDPTDPTAPVTAGESDADAGGSGGADNRPIRAWIEELWRYLIERHALGRAVPEPDWFCQSALCKLTVTRPDLAKRLGLSPFNFCLVAQVQPLQGPLSESESGLRLLAPFESDPKRWKRLRWIDAYSGQAYKIETGQHEGHTTPGVVYVKSHRDVAAEFLSHPEAKLATPDGRRCPRAYRGLLVRRTVNPGEEVNIGKEANHIEDVEAGILTAQEALNSYSPSDAREAAFDRYVRPALRTLPVAVVRTGTGLSERTIKRVRADGHRPSPRDRTLLTKFAVEECRRRLRKAGRKASREDREALVAYIEMAGEPAICGGPGCDELVGGRRRYCSDACRKAADRLTLAAADQHAEPRICAGCGAPLTGRARRWCSEVCRARARRTPSRLDATTAAGTGQAPR